MIQVELRSNSQAVSEKLHTVDARGLPCPQPVILTRNALRESDVVTIIVDNDTAQHNVTRMAERSGSTVKVEERADGTYLCISRGDIPMQQTSPQPAASPTGAPLVLMVSSESMGRGEHAELGQILARGFFHTLGEVDSVPDTIIFLNSGVKLVVESSPVLEDLRDLCARGVEILSCGTCLEYYDLKKQVAVGEVSNMYTVAETMLGAGKVVNL